MSQNLRSLYKLSLKSIKEMSLQITTYIYYCLRDFNSISSKYFLNFRYTADVNNTYLILSKYSLMRLLSVSFDLTAYNIIITCTEIIKSQNVL